MKEVIEILFQEGLLKVRTLPHPPTHLKMASFHSHQTHVRLHELQPPWPPR